MTWETFDKRTRAPFPREYERFVTLTRQLLRVPKSALAEKLCAEVADSPDEKWAADRKAGT